MRIGKVVFKDFRPGADPLFEGVPEDYYDVGGTKIRKSLMAVQKSLMKHGVAFEYAALGCPPGHMLNGLAHTPDCKVVWRRYCGISTASAQNWLYVDGVKQKTQEWLQLNDAQRGILLRGARVIP